VPRGRGAAGGHRAPAAQLAGGATSLEPKGDCFRGDRRVGPVDLRALRVYPSAPIESQPGGRVDPNQLPLPIGSLRGQLSASDLFHAQRAGQASRAAEPHTSIDPAFSVWCCPLADRSTALHWADSEFPAVAQQQNSMDPARGP
jgi:hypothetical protein